MSNKTISAKDKISAVLLYFEGNISQHQLAEQLEVSLATVQQAKKLLLNTNLLKDSFSGKHVKYFLTFRQISPTPAVSFRYSYVLLYVFCSCQKH